MVEEKYVNLVTVYKGYNYGSSLQAFALKSFLEKNFSCKCNVVNHKERGFKKFLFKLKKKIFIFFKSFSSSEIFERTWHSHLNKKQILSFDDKTKFSFDRFSDNYIKPRAFSYKELKKSSSSSDCLACICGSDQLWNPSSVLISKDSFLYFSNCNKNISYAVSIGVNYIPKHNYAFLKKSIKNFKAISFRENSASLLFEKEFGIKTITCLDPVLLVGKEFWEKYTYQIKEKNYIFCYFLNSPSKTCLEFLKRKTKEGKKIIVLTRCKSYFNFDKIEFLFGQDPFSFVSYIKDADIVLTDSYHGMLFSSLFNVNFLIFKRDYGDNVPQESRILDYLAEYKMLERYVKKDLDNTANANFELFNKNLVIKQAESFDFLKRHIHGK